ncbi:hypothetical protein OCA08_22500 [Bacillus cereus]|nr:hypothetical protein [Bacillus cereus]
MAIAFKPLYLFLALLLGLLTRSFFTGLQFDSIIMNGISLLLLTIFYITILVLIFQIVIPKLK